MTTFKSTIFLLRFYPLCNILGIGESRRISSIHVHNSGIKDDIFMHNLRLRIQLYTVQWASKVQSAPVKKYVYSLVNNAGQEFDIEL